MDEVMDVGEPVEAIPNPFAAYSLEELRAEAVRISDLVKAEQAKDQPDLQVLSDLVDQLNQVAAAREQQVADAAYADQLAASAEQALAAVTAALEPAPAVEVAPVAEVATEAETVVETPVVEDAAPLVEVVEEVEVVEASAETIEEEVTPEADAEGEQNDAVLAEGDNEMENVDPEVVAEAITSDAAAVAGLAPAPKRRVGFQAATASKQAGEFITLSEFGEAASEILSGHGSIPQTVVASLPGYELLGDGAAILSQLNGAQRNDMLIAEARANKAKSAVASFCEPLEIIREVPICGVTDTPFRNLFTALPMARGGFTFTPAPTVTGATTVWTEADQALVDPLDPNTWKGCGNLGCTTPKTEKADEIVGCITFDDSTEMSAPATIASAWGRVQVDGARASEINLLDKFDAVAFAEGGAFSYATTPAGLGNFQALGAALNDAVNRLTDLVRVPGSDYVAVLPFGLVRLLAGNEGARAYSVPGDVIARFEDIIGMRTVSLLDHTASELAYPALVPNAVTPLAGTPAAWRIRLVPANAFFLGLTGAEDFGVERSPELRKQNKAQMFMKQYQALGKVGCEVAGYVDATVCMSGGTAAFVDPACIVA